LGSFRIRAQASQIAGEGELPGGKKFEFSRELSETTALEKQSFGVQIIRALIEGGATKRMDVSRLVRVLEAMNPPFPDTFSFAPIRSKPKRTYDETGGRYSPEGEHVPRLLARLLRQQPDSTDSRRVQQALLRFGKESGLFRGIHVKKLGHKVTDPFQLQIATQGPPVNVADVGYGVSQSLPIVVQSVLAATSKVMLLQQPEVHLHPRAQAALGTFFADLVSGQDRLLVVETHSDYLVDRVRQEVAAQRIKPEDVGILFFHKPQLETSVSELELDENGNVLNAPAAYRDFFLQEQMNLFSRTEA
jgi:hypothetical protein